ncbi:MAG TPA: benzoylformate decarboxylase [Steroidobacteraceae bacterium]|nr:benzoylformate decarboxylase [Steroidobacteraceae bacterium]
MGDKAAFPSTGLEAGPATQVTVREAVFDLFRAFRLTTIFGNPGSTELPMFRDFPADFRYVLGLQESLCVGMADGFAQATRNAALVNLHSAVGVGHALGNIFTAYRNQTPLLITAGQQARSILPYEPFLYSQQAAEFPRPYVKWSVEPARAEDVPAAIARAYYMAMQAPRGPTLVSIPVDDWDRDCTRLAARTVGLSGTGDATLLAQAAAALARAQRPAIVVGAGVSRDDAWAETIALAERHQAAVWVSPMSSRNSFPEDHRLFAGFLAADRERIVQSLAGTDLILVLGAPAFTYHVEGFGPHVPAGAELIQLVDDPSIASWTPVGVSIVTHLKLGVHALLAGPTPVARSAPRVAQRPPRLNGAQLTDSYLLQQMAALRPKGSVVVEEAPSSRGPMHDYLPITERDGFYTCASGGLGHGLPAAVGVALGRPEAKVIALLGDGSSMYSIQGLWSAAQLGLKIAFIIVKNGRYEALHEFGRRFDLKQLPGTALPQLDFCSLATAQGVRAIRVERAAELTAALTEAFRFRESILVEVVVEDAAGGHTQDA